MSDITIFDAQTGEVVVRNYTQEEIDNIARLNSQLDELIANLES